MKTGVFIKRKWGQAEIEVDVYKRGEAPDGTFIQLRAGIDDFREMLKDALKKSGGDVDQAVDAVLQDIKEVTNKVMK